MAVLLPCPGRAREAQGALLYPGAGRNSTGSKPCRLFCVTSPALEDRSGRKQSCFLICGTSRSYSNPDTLGTPIWASLGKAGSEGQQEQQGRQLCLHQQQTTHCTSQAFGRPRQSQSLFALGKKISLSTSKQRTHLAENLNPLSSPGSNLLPSPRRGQSPAGCGTQEELQREGGVGLQPPQDPGQRCRAGDRPCFPVRARASCPQPPPHGLTCPTAAGGAGHGPGAARGAGAAAAPPHPDPAGC